MCGSFDFIFIIAVFIYGVCYSFRMLKNGVLDVISFSIDRNTWGIVKAVLKITAVPLIFLGVQLAGILFLELMYSCQ